LSDTTDVTSDFPGATDASPSRRRRAGGGLAGMLLGELQQMASSMGISGTARMRKGDLIAAIEQSQADGRVPRARTNAAANDTAARAGVRGQVRDGEPEARQADQDATAGSTDQTRQRGPRRASRPAGPPEPREDRVSVEAVAVGPRTEGERRERFDGRGERGAYERNGADRAGVDRGERSFDRNGHERGGSDRTGSDRNVSDRNGGERGERVHADRNGGDRNGGDRNGADRNGADRNGADRNGHDRGGQERADRNGRVQVSERGHAPVDEDDEGGGRRGRRSRFRDRRRGRGERGTETTTGEPTVTEDDVLVQVAGIVDVLDNYAFIRTSGYLAGPNDVYVSMAQIKRYGLRRGDAVTGAVRAAREGEQRRDKYNPLVRLDTINGMDPEVARSRPEFYKLTPLYPQERLRLETESHILTTRVIDLVMPIGKGQRALIVSPPKAGKTMIQQAIANAITRNNPECHLMVVLVDERPEEVTDMQRSVKGEVIASTFDRPPQDHTTVAELAIERAKRLVELGHDVVVLLDSITRLGRAYNLAAPASGRILSGGIDSTALYPPKRFLGAARNIENGGSLTIIANALVETGSMMDTVIFEEFKGTGNAELKLDRKIADKRVFPAIDIDPSGTRKEEILLAPDEYAIIIKLRKVLHSLESQAALDLLLDKLKQTRTNVDFLMQIAKTTPGD
jgi:transcription termination factor Rho